MERVACDKPGCDKSTTVKLAGTMPSRWYGRYIEPGSYKRYCSQQCLDATRNSTLANGG